MDGGRTLAKGLSHLVEAARLVAADDVPALLVEYAKTIGAEDAALYLVDYEQRVLAPVPNPAGPERDEVLIDTTLAGRCFRLVKVQQTTIDDGRTRLWVPVLDGIERLGVLELVFCTAEPDVDKAVRLASLLAEVVVTKQAYGDLFERVRRRQAMSVAAELAWRLLPPLTFGTDRLVISAALAPAYQLGGDCFDYAVDSTTARIAVFDAMGHGLEAGLLASVAMAACRTTRRAGGDLADTAAAIHEAVETYFGADRFVTALLADLELASGRLRWTVSGHPPPLLLRDGRIVKTLAGQATPPLGVSGDVVVAEEKLQPGDQVLFYTDGVVEARSAAGEFFGIERLVDMVVRTSAAEAPLPETMRRLLHAILDHQDGEMQDDATILVVEWRSSATRLMAP